MSSNRRTDLLHAAATALENGEDPLALHFLSEHEVTADECHSLAEQLAIGARLVAKGLNQPRSEAGRAVMMSLVEAL